MKRNKVLRWQRSSVSRPGRENGTRIPAFFHWGSKRLAWALSSCSVLPAELPGRGLRPSSLAPTRAPPGAGGDRGRPSLAAVEANAPSDCGVVEPQRHQAATRRTAAQGEGVDLGKRSRVASLNCPWGKGWVCQAVTQALRLEPSDQHQLSRRVTLTGASVQSAALRMLRDPTPPGELFSNPDLP